MTLSPSPAVLPCATNAFDPQEADDAPSVRRRDIADDGVGVRQRRLVLVHAYEGPLEVVIILTGLELALWIPGMIRGYRLWLSRNHPQGGGVPLGPKARGRDVLPFTAAVAGLEWGAVYLIWRGHLVAGSVVALVGVGILVYGLARLKILPAGSCPGAGVLAQPAVLPGCSRFSDCWAYCGAGRGCHRAPR